MIIDFTKFFVKIDFTEFFIDIFTNDFLPLLIPGVFHGGEPTLIVGGRAIVCPCIQTIQRLPLSTITLLVQSPKVYTSQGVAISVTGVAQVKNS